MYNFYLSLDIPPVTYLYVAFIKDNLIIKTITKQNTSHSFMVFEETIQLPEKPDHFRHIFYER